ncbi:TetR/AcrR family transcriptional regulator [Oryzobacter sp. R7]|uniref:TetR/AcrR family transcriptional regulator n=1 Tax=Oryzobacter faecalis TaxID=3388656 RepID=UPI00398CFEFD
MPRVSEEHRSARREQILRAAMDSAAEEGFHKTTMAHVIERSGLSAGAVYGYFRSKDEIIAALAEHALGIVGHALDGLLAGGHTPSVPELVGHLGRTVEAQAAATGVDLTRVMVAAWAEAVRDEAVRAVAGPKVAELRGRVADVIAALQAEGRWDRDADPALVAQAAIGLVPGFVLQRLIVRDVTPEGYSAAVAGLLGGQREP